MLYRIRISSRGGVPLEKAKRVRLVRVRTRTSLESVSIDAGATRALKGRLSRAHVRANSDTHGALEHLPRTARASSALPSERERERKKSLPRPNLVLVTPATDARVLDRESARESPSSDESLQSSHRDREETS